MLELSHSTKLFEKGSEASEILNYLISRSLLISRSHTWTQLECQSSPDLLERIGIREESVEGVGREKSLAIIGTKENAVKRKRTVEEDMFVTSAERGDTKGRNVGKPENSPKRPKYLQRSVWANLDDLLPFSPTAASTVTDDPLPRPSREEFENTDAILTISKNPDLFRIITPINVDKFEQLLIAHPNQPFVESVCTSLREGFWPWACTQKEEYPITWDFSNRPPKNEHEAIFLRGQRDIEVAAERYSEDFGTDLLPGMYSTPIHAVPKPRSEKLRLVNDHSAGPFSLNSMIAREDIAGAKMDSIADLVEALLRYRADHLNKKLVMFKSDVSAAY